MSLDSSASIVTGFGVGDRGSIFLAGERGFSLLDSVHTGSGAYPASYSMGTAASIPDQSGRSLKLTTHLRLVSR
jgi:hypothetical protein